MDKDSIKVVQRQQSQELRQKRLWVTGHIASSLLLKRHRWTINERALVWFLD